jgi:hypothetical protein
MVLTVSPGRDGYAVISGMQIAAAGVAPSITTQPQSQTVCSGDPVIFSAAAEGSAPLSYQWTFNGANIPGANGTTYTINNPQVSAGGTYTVVVTNPYGTASASATLTVGGIQLLGIANGAVLSGQVTLNLAYGNCDPSGNLQWLFLADTNPDNVLQGTSFPDLSLGIPNPLTGSWDTTEVPNGTYTIQMTAALDDGTDYADNPVTVTISNPAWFFDPWNVGGTEIFVGVQTIYTDCEGTWLLEIYDDQNDYVGYAEGPIDSNGYFAWPDTPGPFSLNNTDTNGNQNPSTYYTMQYTTDAAHPISATRPYNNLTRRVTIEVGWNIQPTSATVVYQDLFGDLHPIGQQQELELMQSIWVQENYYHWEELGSPQWPTEIAAVGGWANVATNPGLDDNRCRDFFWLGHGCETSLGSGGLGGTAIRSKDIGSGLRNNIISPLTGPNYHPYRFVFLDGCNTANGNWPQAFGIPKQTGMTMNDFLKRGVRPRAFLGWNYPKQYTWVQQNEIETNFLQWNENFWAAWQSYYNNDPSQPYGLWDAVQKAQTNPDGTKNTGASGATVYGATDLTIVK